MDKDTRNKRKKNARKTFNPLKWILLLFALLAIFVFIGVFGIKSAVMRYLKSDAFRDHLITVGEKKLHADIDLKQFRWDGSTIYADGWRAQGYAKAPFTKMEVDGLRATFNGAENSAWQIPEIRVNQASFEFSEARLPSPDLTAKPSSTTSSDSPSVPQWLKKWIPDHAEIGVIRIDTTNLRFLDEQGRQQLALTSVETSAQPLSSSRTWEIKARNGELIIPTLPELSIKQIETRWNHNEIFINQASFLFHKTAEINGTGDITLGPETSLNLDLHLSNLDCKKLLSPHWEKKVSGKLHGDFTIKGNPKKQLSSKGTFYLKDGVLEGLPLLDLIAQYTKMQRFKRLALHKAQADFTKSDEAIEFKNLVIQSDGLMRLEGSFTLNGRQIENGRFRLGVTPGTLRWIPGAEQNVFTTAKDGFLWTDLTISGSLDQPNEDLSARLAGAAINTLINDAPAQATEAAKKMLNDPSSTIDTGKKLLDSLIPLLK